MPGLFGNSIDLLLAPDLEGIGLGAFAEQLWAILQSAQLQNIPAPLVISNPSTDQPAIIADNSNGSPLLAQIKRRPQDKIAPIDIPGESVPSSGGGTASSTIREVQVQQVLADTLVVADPNDASFAGTRVAKPPLLRSSVLSLGNENYTYTASDAQARTATDAQDNSEDQVVIPPYQAGSTLYILQTTKPITAQGSLELILSAKVTFIDMNVDARAWASKIPSDDSGGGA